jgi:hypothetical protein
MPSYWLGWGLVNYLPRLASNCDPPNLSLPNSSDFRCEAVVLGVICVCVLVIRQTPLHQHLLAP